jgi:hypothetical protein
VNNVNWCANVFTPQIKNVLEYRLVRPVLAQDFPAKRVLLTERDGLYSYGFCG